MQTTCLSRSNHRCHRCWTAYSLAMQKPRHPLLCHVGIKYGRDVVRSVPLLSATLPFQLRRIMNLDGPHALVREGSMDLFPRTAIVPHLDQRCILFWCLFNTLFLRLQQCLTCLGMCSNVVMGRNICWRLLARINVQCFGINR
jgi:hypothetical protein